MKRTGWSLIGLFVVAAIIVAGIWLTIRLWPGGMLSGIRHGGGASVERWVGRQLQNIANDALRPEFTFARLEYEFPATATLHDVRFVDGDTEFITASSAAFTFAQAPRPGTPIVIKAVTCNDLVVKLIEGPAGLVGFSDFIESKEGQVSDDGGSTRPSDVFAVRQLEVRRGRFVYDDGIGTPMELDQLDLSLATDPRAEPGEYAVNVHLDRPPVMALKVEGSLNIDNSVARFDRSELSLQVAPDEYKALPPVLQAFLRDNEIVGSLTMGMTGVLPIAQPAESDLAISAGLDQAAFSRGEFRWQIDTMSLEARLAQQRWMIAPVHIAALDGHLRAELEFPPELEGPARATIQIDGMRVERALRDDASKGPPAYAGRVELETTASARLSQWPESLDGAGSVNITEGRLINVRVVSALAQALKVASRQQPTVSNDRASADLILTGRGLEIRRMRIVGGDAAARGDGEIRYDGAINFRVNAGPVEKAQDMLGAVGDVLGAVTDRVVTYHVTGTLENPKVAVRPLGIGASKDDRP